MLKDAGCIVFKVGTSTLMHPTKKTNIHVVDCLAQVLSDLANAGKRVVLVTSGAIGFGVEKLGLPQRPRDTAGKQAAATVGPVRADVPIRQNVRTVWAQRRPTADDQGRRGTCQSAPEPRQRVSAAV